MEGKFFKNIQNGLLCTMNDKAWKFSFLPVEYVQSAYRVLELPLYL